MNTHHALAARLLLFLLAFSAVPAAQDAPVFEPAATAPAAVQKAKDRAVKKHKRVCLLWGSDSGPGHVALRTALARGKTKAWPFYYEYELVALDAAADAELARSLGVELAGEGPFLTLLDADGKVLEHRSAAPMRQGDGWNEAALGTLLASHAVEPQDAEKVLAAALARAEHENMRLLVHFGAPW